MLEYKNTKKFLLKYTRKMRRKTFLSISKIKYTVPWTYVISDLNGEPITGSFYEKEF